MGVFEGEGDQTVSYEGLEIHVVSLTTKKEVVCSVFSDSLIVMAELSVRIK